MNWLQKLFSWLSRCDHAWSRIGRQRSDGHRYQVCFECGQERRVKIDLDRYVRQSSAQG